MSRKVPSIVTAEEAVADIQDKATILGAGFASCGVATELHLALRDRFKREQHPAGITYIHAAGQTADVGLDLLLEEGLLGRLIGAHWGLMRKVTEAIPGMAAEVHNWPQGVVIAAIRAAARGEDDGYLTRIGLGTFVDPDLEGGCANQSARRSGSLIRKVMVEDKPMLRFAPIRPDVALVRGWSADRNGNVSCRKEAFFHSIFNFALATRRNGGKVICQVREQEDRVFSSDEIDLPGFLIDQLVICSKAEHYHRQVTSRDYDPALTGCEKAPKGHLPPVPEGLRGWIGRRAAMEIHNGEILNLGIGIPGDTVGPALAEQQRADAVISTIEAGVIGGIPMGGMDFGAALYPELRIQPDRMFDLYYGGNLDIAIMGAAEIDGEGNINVSSFGGRSTGCGGFIDITQSARRVVFCCPLTVSGLEAEYKDGQVKILQEGKVSKMVKAVGQVTFSAKTARQLGQKIMLVTERAVFRLAGHGWELIEIAPGIDVERNILPNLHFPITISPDLKQMPLAVFDPRP